MASRRSLDTTRELLLDAGRDLLIANGIHVGMDDINLIDVCRNAGLKTAGSGYKIWPNQDEFRADLVTYLMEHATASFATIDDIDATIARRPLPPLGELIRTAARANEELNTSTYPLYVVLWLSAQSDASLGAVFREQDEKWLAVMAEFFAHILDVYDLELVPPFTIDQFATAISGLVEGFTIRRRATPELVPDEVLRPTGPDGTLQSWTLYAIGVEAIFAAFTRRRGSSST